MFFKIYLNFLFSFVVFSSKVTGTYLADKKTGGIHKNKNFSSQENNLFIKIKVSKIPFKSGTTIFTWRLTWNYAYSHFNREEGGRAKVFIV